MADFPIYTGPHATAKLIEFCLEHDLKRFILVADENTYAALGAEVASALRARALDVRSVILPGPEVIADEAYLTQVLLSTDRSNRMFLAVGSGTITDITRLVSHRTKAYFISMPTAPSVDGFASVGAPVVIGGLKQTILAHAPCAIFADLPTLQAAPPELIAAGFGDMVGKFTSLADWKLGHLLWDEPYDAQIAQRAFTAVQTCTDQAEAIGQHSARGISSLMAGLIESGLCLLEFGTSRPASGAEHHCSHYWEMKLLRENRPALLHGAKVGLATILIADRYDALKQLTQQQIIERLAQAIWPDRAQEVRAIEQAYGATAGPVIQAQERFLNLPETEFAVLKEKVIANWPQIQDIAAKVPSATQITSWLHQVGAPTTAADLGLSATEVDLALRNGHYLRDRFTSLKLSRLLQLQPLGPS
jgi:glycerol-1-phosphate dehydrogenase [NAD(P)+]